MLFRSRRMMLSVRSGTSGKWVIAGSLLAGLLLRLLLLHFRPPLGGDALVYGNIASNVLQHKLYALTDSGVLKPTLIRLPGYPLFLATCFVFFGAGNFTAPVLFQIILDLVASCAIGLLAKNLLGPRAGLWALGLTALCPFTANYSVVPLTETLSIFCIAMAFYALERWLSASETRSVWNPWLIVVSLACAYAALLRPDRVLLFAVLVCAVGWHGLRHGAGTVWRRIAPALVITAFFCLPLSIWMARNWRVFHVIQPLAPKYANDPGEEVALGFMRWYRTWGVTYRNTVEVYWPYDDSLLDFAELPGRAFDNVSQREETRGLIDRYNQESSSTPEIDAQFAHLARERIAAHPVRYYFVLPAARLANMWFQPRTELLRLPLDWWRWKLHRGATVISGTYVVWNAVVLLLAVFGTRRWRLEGYSGKPSVACAIFAFIGLRSLLLATLDNAEQRYTIDCFPLLLLLASFAFVSPEVSAEPD